MDASRKVDAVEVLRRQYLQLLDPNKLVIPSSSTLRSPNIQAKIYRRLFDDVHVRYPPPVPYQLRALKRIIKAVEAAIEDPDEDEISDELSGHLALLMSKSTTSSSSAAAAADVTETGVAMPAPLQQKSYVTYSAPSLLPQEPAFEITLLETPSVLASAGTTGFRTWEAALHLVVELGAGTGLLSLLCAKYLGAKHVLATDGSIEVVNDIKQNAALNDLGQDQLMEVIQLQWGHSLLGSALDSQADGHNYQLAIGADVTYDPQSMPALLASTRDIFELHPSIKILIAATVRNQATIDCFLQACDENAFNLEDLEMAVPKYIEQTGLFFTNEPNIRIFEISKSSPPKDAFAV